MNDAGPQEINNRTRITLLTWVAVGVSMVLLSRLTTVCQDQLTAHFDLVWESPGLGTVNLIRDGKNPYDPKIYADQPFIITIYTPLYFYLVALLPEDPNNPFFHGRLVSCLAMLLAAGTLFVVDLKQRILPVAFFAFGIYFSFYPVVSNTAFLKCDPLALCFSAIALVVIYNFRDQRWAPIVASLMCILSLATKQSYISAAVAITVYLALTRRRQLVLFLGASAVFSILFVLFANSVWGEGFWFSTVTALRQEMSFQHGMDILGKMYHQPTFIGLLALTGLVTYGSYQQRKIDIFRESPYLLFVLASMTVLLLTIWKYGASTNYFFEFILAQLMWFAFTVRKEPAEFFLNRTQLTAAITLLALCVMQFLFANELDYSFASDATKKKRARDYESMRSDIASLGIADPVILNPFSHRHTYSLSPRGCVNDHFLYRHLWKDGILDIQTMISTVVHQQYDVIMVPEKIVKSMQAGPLPGVYGQVYGDLMQEVSNTYRIGQTGTEYVYFVRKPNS